MADPVNEEVVAAQNPGAKSGPAPRAFGPGWVGGWGAVLALALWLSQLTLLWLLILILGATVWTTSAIRRRDATGSVAAALLVLATGIAVATQVRLAEISSDWPALETRIEESAATALGEALDDLLESGERSVDGAAAAAELYAGAQPSPQLFDRLEVLQRSRDVSAIALFDTAGATLAWAGEHRGMVPVAASSGGQSYLFDQGPLFDYLYFVRTLPTGVVATTAFLLDARVEEEEGIVPFAERFERRYGSRPLFRLTECAAAEAVWDWATDQPILSVCFAEMSQQSWWERVVEDGRRSAGAAGLLALLLLSATWYRSRMEGYGVPVLVGTAALLIAPLGPLTGADQLFSPLRFVLPGPLDVTLGVLIVLLLGASIWLLTRSSASFPELLPPWLGPPLLALLFPLALLLVEASAASGLLAARPAGGFAVQLATALLLAVPILLIARLTRPSAFDGSAGPVVSAVAWALPALLGIGLLLLWDPAMPVPYLGAALWAIPAVLLLGRGRGAGRPSSGRVWLIAAWIAGTLTLAYLWPLHLRAELNAAEREIDRIGADTDPFLDFLLRQFGEQATVLGEQGESGVNLLYHSWVGSGLAREGYEARMTLWEGQEPVAELNLSELPPFPDSLAARLTVPREDPLVRYHGGADGLQYLLVAPTGNGRIVTVAIPPRRRLAWTAPLARFLDQDENAEPSVRAQSLDLVPVGRENTAAFHSAVPARPDTIHWVATEQGWRSETVVSMPDGDYHAHLVIEKPRLPLLLTRAILVQTGLLLVFTLLWLAARVICRELGTVPLLGRGWIRSFRGRLSLALFFFFLLPTLVFGAVSYRAVAREVIRSAAALAQQALDQAATRMPAATLPEVGGEIQSDLLMYRGGTLAGATAPELLDLGLFHTWLPSAVHLRFAGGEDIQQLEERSLAESDYLVAYRRLDPASVLAAPIPLDSREITRRQQEFRDVALLVILGGLALSMVLALLVSRALSRPLDELSRAAATVGAGNFRTPLPEARPDEFGSVYDSFNRMVRRLRRTRAALVQETRRTEAIVAEAATGVVALDAEGCIELINPRAAEILGKRLQAGESLLKEESFNPFARAIHELWRSPSREPAAEVEEDGRIVRMKLRRLAGEVGGGGAVVALEDVTAEVRTARVLAWGEMARQVAHEIKNPLTPIKLAVQHMRRAFLDRRPDFDQILDRNVEAILSEIDRLGEIARAFSRFGTPAATASPLEPVDVRQVVAEVLALYRGTADEAAFRVELPEESLPPALARGGELKEVLLNLLENAREAVIDEGEILLSVGQNGREGWLSIIVADTGVGIPEDQLPRIFEPHFSTRSSGTGLGLAIVRRIVDSWGGEIRAESAPSRGSRFEILVRAAPDREAVSGPTFATPPSVPSATSNDGGTMTDLKRGEQKGGERSAGVQPSTDGDDQENRGAEFGTSERATRGTNRDFDESNQSANQGHGHPREERTGKGE